MHFLAIKLLTNAFAPGASLNELRTAFPKDASIVAAGGWNNIETLAKSDPKKALVDFVVDGLKSADSAVQPSSQASRRRPVRRMHGGLSGAAEKPRRAPWILCGRLAVLISGMKTNFGLNLKQF